MSTHPQTFDDDEPQLARGREIALGLPDPAERPALLQDPRCFHPAYLGPSGWVAVELPAARAASRHWTEIVELVEESYRNTAGKRLVAELDARTG